jgi:hypothetical protein
VRKMKGTMRGIVGFVFVLSAFGLMLMYEHFGPNRAGSKLREIETLWSAIPPYSRSIEISSDSNSSGRKAYISKKYKSDAGYDDIKSFYHEFLTWNGWYLIDERHFTDWGIDKGGIKIEYRQGDYKLSIEYAGKNADREWDYGIGIGWSSY